MGFKVASCARSERRGVSGGPSAPRSSAARRWSGCAGRTASSAPAAAIGSIACWRVGVLYQCNRCKKQTSPTAGTIFHATKLPLTLWFAAIHLIVTAKSGISSVELGRRLGVKQPTVWTVCMRSRPDLSLPLRTSEVKPTASGRLRFQENSVVS